MSITEDRAVARKMNKLRMFDIVNSIQGAATVVLSGIRNPAATDETRQWHLNHIAWLEEACNEWVAYVNETKRELGIHAD